MKRLLLALALLPALAFGQAHRLTEGAARLDGGAGGPDAKHVQGSTTLPSTCAVRDVYIDTDAPAGTGLYYCSATNTWTNVGGGITNSAPLNVVPKSDGTNLVASTVSDNATTLTLGNAGVTVTEATGAFGLTQQAVGTVPLAITGMTGQTGSLLTLTGGATPGAGFSPFLSVTGTLPASPSAAVSGITETITSAGSAAQIQRGHSTSLAAGYTGTSSTVATRGSNTAAGTSVALYGGNSGVAGEAIGDTAGTNFGFYGYAQNNGSGKAVGGVGSVYANSTGERIGLLGVAANIGANKATGVMAYIGGAYNGAVPAVTTSAALIADNSDTSAPIFLARDNGTTVFSVDDANATVSTITQTAPTGAATRVSGSIEELITCNTGGVATVSATNLAPANSKIASIVLRVTTTITTAASYTVAVTGGNAFALIGTATTSLTSLTAGNTLILVPVLHADQYVSSATTLTITFNAAPGAGVIRATVFYDQFTAPTS